MPNYKHSEPADAGQTEMPRPESFTARRIRVINAARAGRRRSGPGPSTMTRAAVQTEASSHPGGEITLVPSGVPLPRRKPGTQITDDAGLKPTQKHDPREHFTAEQVTQVRTALMELGERGWS